MTTAPAALAYSADNCTVGRFFDLLGDRSTLLVIREVFVGIRRFEDLRIRTGMPKQVLTNRLADLVEHGVLRKEPYQVPGQRARHEYRLTAKGLDLYPVLVAVADWGDRYLVDPEGPPVEFVHRDCGGRVEVRLACTDGHLVGSNREVVSQVGPGARLR